MTSVRKIQQATAEFYGIPIDKLRGRSRQKRFSEPRQVAMYLARTCMGWSYPRIAKAFNRLDHTTVIHAVRQVESTPAMRDNATGIATEVL